MEPWRNNRQNKRLVKNWWLGRSAIIFILLTTTEKETLSLQKIAFFVVITVTPPNIVITKPSSQLVLASRVVDPRPGAGCPVKFTAQTLDSHLYL